MSDLAVTVLVRHPLDLTGERVAELIKKAIDSGLEDAALTLRDSPEDEDANAAIHIEVVAVRHEE